MKEKRYKLPEEQKDAAFAAEPAPAYHGNAAIALPEDECAEEDIDWNRFLLAGIRLMKKKPWLGLKLLRRSMKGQALAIV